MVVVFRKVFGVAAILEEVCNKPILFNKWVGFGFRNCRRCGGLSFSVFGVENVQI
jgi:hypothetical protein